MLPVGLAVTLAGYTLIYFGVESLRGPGVGLLDLIVPGRWAGGAQVAPPSSAAVSSALKQPGATGANSEVQGPNRKIM